MINDKNIFYIILIIIILIIIVIFKYTMNYFYHKNKKINNIINTIDDDKIEEMENINNFNNIDNITKLNSNSFNGFINIIKYNNNFNTQYSILKSNIGSGDEDNLIYEYVVGLFINTKLKIFPCFIKTYGFYKYKNKEYWEILKNNNYSNSILLKEYLEPIKEIDISFMECNKNFCIILQYINNPIKLKEKIKETEFVKYELFNILYQIYFPLSTLSNIFTHNDLNCNNILLYEIENNNYINYHYHLIDGREIKFKSKYIVKIIDYGNTYFNDGINSTEKIYEKICQTISCDDDCYKYSINNEYKRPIIINFLLNEIIIDIANQNINNIKILENIQNENINSIFNILNTEFINNTINENNYLENIKIGDLHIFQDGRDMIFKY